MKFCPSCGGIAADEGCVTSVGLSPKYGPLLRIDCQVLGTSYASAPLAPGPAHDILAELGRFLSTTGSQPPADSHGQRTAGDSLKN